MSWCWVAGRGADFHELPAGTVNRLRGCESSPFWWGGSWTEVDGAVPTRSSWTHFYALHGSELIRGVTSLGLDRTRLIMIDGSSVSDTRTPNVVKSDLQPYVCL